MQLVLRERGEPMRYEEIAQEILDQGLRAPTPTPAATVSATLSLSLQREGANSPFVRIDRGLYALRELTTDATKVPRIPLPVNGATALTAAEVTDDAVADAQSMGLINAFGMFWRRDEVHWNRTGTRLLGVQQTGGASVDFSGQAGVYLLYDGSRVVYVGRVTGERLGMRMWEHTRDRLTGRWDRFSWFGVRAVTEEGALGPLPGAGIAVDSLISTMEALLIEGLEPPQNRRQGEGFNALEFLQESDPEITRKRNLDLLSLMQERLRS